MGLSVDGPRELQDHYRVDKGGQPTCDRVMYAWECLQEHKVEHNRSRLALRRVGCYQMFIKREEL